MGFFSKLLPKKKVDESKMTLADYLNMFPPIYSDKVTDVIKNDVFRAGCACICREMRKIHAEHVRMDGTDPIPQNSNISFVLANPNPLMTESDFYEKITWVYLTKENCFIYPKYENGELKYLYPLEPTNYKFVEYNDRDDLYVRMWFGNGKERYETTLPYESLIHLRRNFTRNEYAGGDESGHFDDTMLKDVVALDDTLTTGLEKQIKLSYSTNIILKLQSTYKQDKELEAIRLFEEKLENSKSGVLAVGLDSQLDTLNKSINFVDTNLVKYIDEKILRPLGVSIQILSGKYTKEDYEAFYQLALEPIIITFSQAFTKGLFTRREIGHKNRIKFYPEELIFLSTKEKLELIRLLGDSGSLYVNEARGMVGLSPIPELKGVRMMSLNYIRESNASKYQVGEDNKKDDDKKDVDKTKDKESEGGVSDE